MNLKTCLSVLGTNLRVPLRTEEKGEGKSIHSRLSRGNHTPIEKEGGKG